MVKTTWQILKQAVTGFIDDEGMRLSAALAYYSAFSLAPLLLIAFAVAGMIFGNEAARGALDNAIIEGMGPNSAPLIQEMMEKAQKPSSNILASVTGGIFLLLGAGGVFAQLQSALNTVWNVQPPPGRGVMGLIVDRFLSFSMVLGIGFLLLVSMLLSTLLQALSGYLSQISLLPPEFWTLANTVLSYLIITILFASIFKILPNAFIRWRDVWVGALFTSALFSLGKFGIGWYLGRVATTSSYGSAAAVIFILMWLHYSAIILLFGAEFTQAYAQSRGRGIGPGKKRFPVTISNGRKARET